MTVSILIVAAGTGQRAGGGPIPKQYQPLGEKPVLAHTVDAFLKNKQVDYIQIVIHPDHETLYNTTFPSPEPRLMPVIYGGRTRQESVWKGLRQLAAHKPDHVLIHDAARPFITPAIIKNTLHALKSAQAVLVAIPVTDTIKKIDNNGLVAKTLDRNRLMAAQTPQGFEFDLILKLHEQAHKDMPEGNFTDDIALAEWQDIPVTTVEGSPANFKITTPEDLLLAGLIWQQKLSLP